MKETKPKTARLSPMAILRNACGTDFVAVVTKESITIYRMMDDGPKVVYKAYGNLTIKRAQNAAASVYQIRRGDG